MSKKLYEQALANSVFMDFVQPVNGFGRRRGETVTLTRVATITEPTSAALDENVRIPEDTFDLSTTSITVTEYGRAVPFTSLAEDLSEFSLENPIQKRLRQQMTLYLDTLAATQFKASYLRAVPTGTAAITWDTDGTTTPTATNQMNLYHLEEIRDAMVGTYFVPMINNHYQCIAHTNALRGIKRDPDFEEWHKYQSPDVKGNSEVGRLEQIIFNECYHSNALSGSKGSGAIGEAVFFGEDSVVMAESVSPELRAAQPEDFGRAQAVAWYAVLGFGLVWPATATAGEVRVVYLTSA